MSEIVTLEDPLGVAHAAGERFLAAAVEAVRSRGRFVVVLSGGSTPQAMHRVLTSSPWQSEIPWSRSVVLFGDERCVPPDHEDSNFHMASETLLDHVGIPKNRIHRIEGELDDPAEAARRYERVLHELYRPEEPSCFDLVMLGIGEDGHTASLFPETKALNENRRLVVANRVPALDSWRITLTFPALCAAGQVLFLATGEMKARVVAEAFGGLPHDVRYPCERVVPKSGRREILVDRAAASRLPRR